MNQLRIAVLADLKNQLPAAHYLARPHSIEADLELANNLLSSPEGLTLRELRAAKALSDWAFYTQRFRAISDTAYPERDCDDPTLAPGMSPDQERELTARREVHRRSALEYARMVDDAQLIERYQTPIPAPEQNTATTAPVAAASASGGVETAKAGPLPLTTADIAFCFAGLRCKTEDEWKTLIGKGRDWVERCLVQPGTQGRGGAPKLWNPVLMGAALVRSGHAKTNSVRAKFQTQPLLTPWLDEWKSYEADNLDTN